MPPSPSLRCSPSREPRTHHKKGQSLESGLSFKEKDDDLALFNDVQSKEQDNFLLQSTDDFEDILSTKFKSLPDLNLGITIPTRGESSDLLNVDEDKNDYEWLLTPPDTPLFPFLDDEHIPVNIVHEGRPRIRAISISRSSIKSYRSRGSASPQRLSPSPRSCGSSTFQSRGRPSSAPRCSPTPSSRHSTPIRRSSPLPGKPSTPPRGSPTPTPRRLSTDSGAACSSGVSPVRSSRGSFSSPKIRPSQSNIPSFSLESPPNLCTSLANRPTSYVRGSSMVRRQSMSPTATRRISSHQRDLFNSHSKVSADSCGKDDADSFLSVSVDGSDHSLQRRGVGVLSSNRPISLSKKPSKVLTSSSAPKRSLDTAMRHLDCKSPQNMFRPLLSSVPSTTFYGGKASSSQYTMASMNSSVTTSSNASSDRVIRGAPDTEGSEHHSYKVASESGKILNANDVNDEIFSFDKMDAAGEDILEIHDQSPDIQLADGNGAGLNCLHPVVYAGEGYAQAESHIDTLRCSKCGCIYNVTELEEGEVNLCPKCKEKNGIMVKSITFSRLDVPHNSPDPTTKISEEVGSSNASVPYLSTPEVMETSKSVMDLHIIPGEENDRESMTTNRGLSKGSRVDNSSADAHMLSDVQVPGQVMDIPDPSTVGIHGLIKSSDVPPSKIDVAEESGISVLLLKRSSSSKGPVIQGRGFAASSVSYDVRSYSRESTSMRSSNGYGSSSMSSSIDMCSTHAEMLMQRQLSGRGSEITFKPERIRSFSQTSSQISQGLGLATIARENFDARAGNEGPDVIEEPETSFKPAVVLENIQRLDRGDCFPHLMSVEEDNLCRSSGTNDTPALELPIDVLYNQLDNSSSPLLPVANELNLDVIDDPLPKKVACGNPEESAATLESSLTDQSAAPNNCVDKIEVVEAPHNDLAEMCEKEFEDCHIVSSGSKHDVVSRDAIQESSALPHEHKSSSDSASKSIESEVVPSILEESTGTVEDQEGRRRRRSITLEEAADTILFCSSIVHSLAYQAATIAINKENETLIPLEGTRPAITIASRPSPDRDLHFRSITKRTPRAHKGKQRGEEVATNFHSSKMEAEDNKPAEPAIRNVAIPHNMESSKPPKLESKCNCTIM